MLAPVVLYYLIFHYGPRYGAVIAFQDFNPVKGVVGSKWIGLQNFQDFFASVYFARLMVNTVAISVLDLVFGFPAPIILALLLNELRWNPFKGLVQTVTYLPHFISVVVVVGMLFDFFARDGLVNDLIASASPTAFMQSPEWFRQLFVGSGIWQQVGWGSIVYLAAIANIDPQLYDAAKVDGANRFRLIRHVTLPGILPVIVILLILRLGSIMSVGYEKILLMYNPLTYETADVISTYVFRRGILQADFSFSAAVGLFNSLSSPTLLSGHRGLLFGPLSVTLEAYRRVFENPMILTGYRNTLFYVIAGTTLNVFMTALGAYALSRRDLLFKNPIMFFIVFTMFFGGGLIPTYLLVGQTLHMQATPWALIVPAAITTINLIIMRTAFNAVPASLEEAARIDGANEWPILFKIYLPLSWPVVAVMILFYGV